MNRHNVKIVILIISMTIFMSSKVKTYETADLALSAYLRCMDHTVRLKKSKSGKCSFLFFDDGNVRQEIMDFWDGKALVDPAKFFHHLKTLKQRIYGEK